jgi:hypothetical protein
MNRLYILLTVMVVTLGALLAGHQALAEVLTGTSGDDTLLGTDKDDRLDGRGGDDEIEGGGGHDRLKGRGGDDEIEGGSGNDEIFPGEGDDEVDAGAGNDLIYARDTGGVDYIDCGGGVDKGETIHRDDRTLSNCERALGPRQGEILGAVRAPATSHALTFVEGRFSEAHINHHA